MTDGREDDEKPKFPARWEFVEPEPPLDAPPPPAQGEAEFPGTPQPAEPIPPAAAQPAAPVQRASPQGWPLAEPPAPLPPPPPPPQYAPVEAEEEPAPRKRRPLLLRLVVGLFKLVLLFVVLSVLWVAAYRFVPPPFTLTMAGDLFGGRGVTKSWMPLSRIDPDMARAAIGGEDARFCTHKGFDFEAIQQALERNARGGRIRGGSTISQQTAKNVFLWQGGGYFRKGLEAWFTFLIENLWGKRRIMEVYLNVAETGIGTYGVNAGSIRYFGHDASRMTPREAAQIAAVLPLPKKRAGIDPRGFTRRYGNSIAARIGVVRNDALDACLR